MDVQYQVAGSHTSCATFHIGFPVVRTDGRAGGRVDVRSRDYQNFLYRLVTRVLSALQSRRKTKQMNSKNFPEELSSENPLVFR